MPKHGVIISDLHCGHKFGLAPPDRWEPESDDHIRQKIHTWQSSTWDWYRTKALQIGHIDRLIVNGDACEGDGIRSGAKVG